MTRAMKTLHSQCMKECPKPEEEVPVDRSIKISKLFELRYWTSVQVAESSTPLLRGFKGSLENNEFVMSSLEAAMEEISRCAASVRRMCLLAWRC